MKTEVEYYKRDSYILYGQENLRNGRIIMKVYDPYDLEMILRILNNTL